MELSVHKTIYHEKELFTSRTALFNFSIIAQLKVLTNGVIQGGSTSGALRIQTQYNWVNVGSDFYLEHHVHFKSNVVHGYYFDKGIEVVGGRFSSFTDDLILATMRNNKVWIKTSGNVGIGDSSPSYKLDVNGDIATYGVLRISSDKRLKKDIVDLDAQKINSLYNLQAKTYIKDNSLLDIENEITSTTGDTVAQAEIEIEIDTTPKIGFIAQDLQEYFPNLVRQDKKGFYSIDYNSLLPVLVEAIKDQQERIVELESQIGSGKSIDQTKGISSSNAYPTDLSQMDNNSNLFQNAPNPFSDITTINYYLAEDVSSPTIYIYNMTGKQLRNFKLHPKGSGEIKINRGKFDSGM
ncbi:MAG: tail fiber domain-containing protein [Bacteroidales bacterium]|nr:tail fiber domain-containing protein [Bacteroidales bacterium]